MTNIISIDHDKLFQQIYEHSGDSKLSVTDLLMIIPSCTVIEPKKEYRVVGWPFPAVPSLEEALEREVRYLDEGEATTVECVVTKEYVLSVKGEHTDECVWEEL